MGVQFLILQTCTYIFGMKLLQVEEQMKLLLSSNIHCQLTYNSSLVTQIVALVKNFQIICFWSLQVEKHFKQIDHKNLVRGQTIEILPILKKRKGSVTVYALFLKAGIRVLS